MSSRRSIRRLKKNTVTVVCFVCVFAALVSTKDPINGTAVVNRRIWGGIIIKVEKGGKVRSRLEISLFHTKLVTRKNIYNSLNLSSIKDRHSRRKIRLNKKNLTRRRERERVRIKWRKEIPFFLVCRSIQKSIGWAYLESAGYKYFHTDGNISLSLNFMSL